MTGETACSTTPRMIDTLESWRHRALAAHIARMLLFVACVHFAYAQSGCDPVGFQRAGWAALVPTSTSRIILLKQNDGSYTGYEVTNTAPFRVMRTVPNFQTQLSQETSALTLQYDAVNASLQAYPLLLQEITQTLGSLGSGTSSSGSTLSSGPILTSGL